MATTQPVVKGSIATPKPQVPAPKNGASGTYSPVTVQQEDTIGAIFLGLITVTLLIAFLRAEARNRSLMAKLSAAA